MKNKGALIVLSVLLFTSCIVKSIHPFYTKESLSFNQNLLGQWADSKNGEWTIASFVESFKKDQKKGDTLSKENLAILDKYKDGYVMTYLKKQKKATFIGMPFTINNQYFIDFIPLEIDDDSLNSIAAQHLLKTHSVVKLQVNSDQNISFSWLSDEKFNDAMASKKMKIAHEKVGIDEDLILTASSKHLYGFLKNYLKSDIKDKWKKSERLSLTKLEVKP